jgi:hypothetical protein
MDFNDGPLEGFEPEEMFAEIMRALRTTKAKQRLARRVKLSEHETLPQPTGTSTRYTFIFR